MLYFFIGSKLAFQGLIGYFFENSVFHPLLFWGLIFVSILAAYLLGSINTAIIVSKKMYNDDVRNYGSGNAGFTNMMRIYGRRAAIITFVGDILKTVVAVMLGWCVFGYWTAYVAGFACFLGHIFPVYYDMKGGKGVVCFASILLVLDWRIFLILAAVFVVSVLSTKYISFGSILCAMVYPILLNRLNNIINVDFTGRGIIEIISIATAVVIVVKHRKNLVRIFNGTESKFSFKKSKKSVGNSENDASDYKGN